MRPALEPAGALGRLGQDLVRLRRRVWAPVGALVLAGLVALGLVSDDLALLDSLGVIFMYVVLTQAWNVLGGYGGYMNFGMAAFFGVGAYTTAVIGHSWPVSPVLATAAAGLASGLFALVVGIPTLRLRGAYFAIATLIVTFAVELVALNAPFTQGSLGIYLKVLPLSPLQTEQLFYFVFLGLMLAATVIVFLIERSHFGWALVAVREDENAAEVLGVRTTRVKILALLLGAVMAGIVGGIYSYRVLYIEPAGTFAIDTSLNVVLMAVLGGAGFWQGPLIGAPVVMAVGDVLRVAVASEVNRLIFGAILVAVALFAPNGVMGFLRGVRGRRFTI
ncbi:MAG TPA: branched-chain amino acid ABC transporter permease [Candidatus Dormibacteraeota bacterium]|nr:branched-chain amino acid ABC transporter permease [Candidatus Dormibacteraeota bacterium]